MTETQYIHQFWRYKKSLSIYIRGDSMLDISLAILLFRLERSTMCFVSRELQKIKMNVRSNKTNVPIIHIWELFIIFSRFFFLWHIGFRLTLYLVNNLSTIRKSISIKGVYLCKIWRRIQKRHFQVTERKRKYCIWKKIRKKVKKSRK